MSSFERSRMQRFLKGATHCPIPKSDAYHSLESWRFHLVNILPKGFKFSASHHVTQILDPLSKRRRTQIGCTNRKLIVPADNARPHTAKMTSQLMEQKTMQMAPHPAYSHDLALFDFYLFGDVQQLLSRCQFPDQGYFLQAVNEIWVGIKK
jgi:hypothetical protein